MNANKYLIYKLVSWLIVLVLFSGCAQTPQAAAPVQPPSQPEAAKPPADTAVPAKVVPAATEIQPTTPAPTLPPVATQPPVKSPEQNLVPLQPGQIAGSIPDVDSSADAPKHTSPAGDDFDINIFERPFTQTVMDYRPDLDITKGEISQDRNFVYVSVYLNNVNLQSGGLQGMYGVELDTDMDGRGDFLVLGTNPNSAVWQKAIIVAYSDTGEKVGGPRAELSDAPQTYAGYDQSIFPGQDPNAIDAAWVRISPDNKNVVQIAMKPSLIGNSIQFLWRVWTDDGPKNVKEYDYNDHFTLKSAGSPYLNDADYPIKDLYQMDNTCWGLYNILSAPKNLQGLCCNSKLPEPVKPGTGGISVLVFGDANANGLHEADESGSCTDVTVGLAAGTCLDPAIKEMKVTLDKNCQYNAKDIKLGKYCLTASGATFTTPVKWDITLSENCPGCTQFNAYFGVK